MRHESERNIVIYIMVELFWQSQTSLAKRCGISRQAVHGIYKRCKRKVESAAAGVPETQLDKE